MRAAVFWGPDRGVEIADVQLDAPKPGEVRVQIAAAGVCRSDLHVRLGDWNRRVPVVMGHEGAGTVVEVGPDVAGLEAGDHVILSWQPACGHCRRCLAGRPQLCEFMASTVAPKGVLYDGTSRLHLNGQTVFHYSGVSSFAEEAVVPAQGAIKIRSDISLRAASLIGCCVTTGVGSVLWTARVRAGARVAVVGCGAVGLSAIQGAVIASAAQVVAVDIADAKLEIAARLGATETVNARGSEAVAAVRDVTGGGADYVFDCIGLPETITQTVAMLGGGGSAVVVGLTALGATASFNPLVLGESEQRIMGSNYGSCRPGTDFPFLADLYARKRLKIDELISAERPLSQAQDALDDLAAGRGIRTVLVPPN